MPKRIATGSAPDDAALMIVFQQLSGGFDDTPEAFTSQWTLPMKIADAHNISYGYAKTDVAGQTALDDLALAIFHFGSKPEHDWGCERRRHHVEEFQKHLRLVQNMDVAHVHGLVLVIAFEDPTV